MGEHTGGADLDAILQCGVIALAVVYIGEAAPDRSNHGLWRGTDWGVDHAGSEPEVLGKPHLEVAQAVVYIVDGLAVHLDG